MNTTLTQARTALLKLVNSVPAQSTYADHLAVLSDYFDNQVPLNIENNNLAQRVAVAEGFVKRVRELLGDTDIVKTSGVKLSDAELSRMVGATPGTLNRQRLSLGDYGAHAKGSSLYGVECSAYLEGAAIPCDCTACRVRANA